MSDCRMTLCNAAQDYLLRVLEAGARQHVEDVPDVPPAGSEAVHDESDAEGTVHAVHVGDVVRALLINIVLDNPQPLTEY